MSRVHREVVVIGAGPAGLGIGYHLSRFGVDFEILERGQRAGESFYHYPKNIFFGPWLNNMLDGSHLPVSWWLRRSRQPDYARYLTKYAEVFRLPIRTSVEVESVEMHPPHFLVKTNQGEMTCNLLVSCAGYYSTPLVPSLPGLDEASVVWMHSHDYREAKDLVGRLNGSRRVLVVGAGLTAGECLLELYRAGCQVSLSHRGPLEFGPSPTKEALTSPFAWVQERIALALGIQLRSNPPMAGGETERLVRSGEVATFPEIIDVHQNLARFVDGTQLEVDAVVFCTGYRYTVSQLKPLLPEGPIEIKNFESVTRPGLFFLGMDCLRTYRSRFLRGIRSDARRLAPILVERLARLCPGRPPAVIPEAVSSQLIELPVGRIE